MNDQMTPLSFETLLHNGLESYKKDRSFFGVPVSRQPDGFISPIGPAAGPHTQMAANCIAAYGAGADHFELKTVQILEGEALGIKKPCIETKYEVYNAEWSTELKVEAALDEYIKAYLLIYVFACEFDLGNPADVTYYMSVGYDLKGIQSAKINGFIDQMVNPSKTKSWQAYITYLKENIGLFETLTVDHINNIPAMISNSIALSTMHGCPKEEIEKIGAYLMAVKGLNTLIKMNPTLLGEEKVKEILETLDYGYLKVDPQNYEVDLSLEEGVQLIEEMKTIAKANNVTFGVKLTNTLPVINTEKHLDGDSVYLSGPALYPIAINVAYRMAEHFNGDIHISYSGGADINNISSIVEAGIYPVTVSSVLLKPGGYKNITKMNRKLMGRQKEQINVGLLKTLAASASGDPNYKQKPYKHYPYVEDYSPLCSACNNCVDVCPNRANVKSTINGVKAVIHYHNLCNECGNCSHFCIKGHDPYKEKEPLQWQ